MVCNVSGLNTDLFLFVTAVKKKQKLFCFLGSQILKHSSMNEAKHISDVLLSSLQPKTN